MLWLLLLIPAVSAFSFHIPDGCDKLSVGACVFSIPNGQTAVDMRNCELLVPYCRPDKEFTITAFITNADDGDSVLLWQTSTEMVEIILTTTQARVLTSAATFDDFRYDTNNGFVAVKVLLEADHSVLTVQLNDGSPVRIPQKHIGDLDWTTCVIPNSTAAVVNVGEYASRALIQEFSEKCRQRIVPFMMADAEHSHRFFFPNATIHGTTNRQFEMNELELLNCQYELQNKPLQINPLTVTVDFCTNGMCVLSNITVSV
jgi:hypothetical protein